MIMLAIVLPTVVLSFLFPPTSKLAPEKTPETSEAVTPAAAVPIAKDHSLDNYWDFTPMQAEVVSLESQFYLLRDHGGTKAERSWHGPGIRRLHPSCAGGRGADGQAPKPNSGERHWHRIQIPAGPGLGELAASRAGRRGLCKFSARRVGGRALATPELTELRDQKAALEAQIAPLQSTVDELVQKGGKIKFNVCGNDRRKCAKVNMGMGTFSKGSENYMILDGY